MAAALVAGAFLSATIQTIADKLSITEFRGFISNTKFNYSLLAELKTTLFSLQAVLVDAEQKQFNDLPVENTPVDQLQNLSSSIKINSKMEKMCKRLQTFVQQKDILGLQRTVSGRVSRRTPSSSVVNESVTSFEGDGLQHLSSIEKLHFRNCQQLESLQENCLPSSLKSLQFRNCERLGSLPEESLPDSLKLLFLWRCPVLQE
ncbi:CC-NBS-LRR resistance protein, partial [Trifolium medium]|nr:CC-NBS-LRR resistance protein [Trifolium medium]